MSEPPEDLRALCPYTRKDALQCPDCYVYASRWRVDRNYSWARVLYCSCGRDWVVCAYCKKNKHSFISASQINTHNRHSHDRKRTAEIEEREGKKTRDSPCAVEDDNEKWIEARNSPKKEKKDDSLLLPLNQDGDRKVACKLFDGGTTTSMRDFGNPQSTAYFNADINGSGMADIVAMCYFGISDVGKLIHSADVQYATDLGDFVHGLTHSQRDNLSRLLGSTVAKVNRDNKRTNNSATWTTSIPTNKVVMRKQFWEGQRAFLSNIPCPTVETLSSHAYTSLRECIRQRLAFGFPLEKVELRENEDRTPVRTLMQSKSSQKILHMCQDLYNEPVIVLFLKEWQDGYDPHAMSKNNRGSCWVKLVTISEPHGNRNSPEVSLVNEHQFSANLSLTRYQVYLSNCLGFCICKPRGSRGALQRRACRITRSDDFGKYLLF